MDYNSFYVLSYFISYFLLLLHLPLSFFLPPSSLINFLSRHSTFLIPLPGHLSWFAKLLLSSLLMQILQVSQKIFNVELWFCLFVSFLNFWLQFVDIRRLISNAYVALCFLSSESFTFVILHSSQEYCNSNFLSRSILVSVCSKTLFSRIFILDFLSFCFSTSFTLSFKTFDCIALNVEAQ